MIQASHDEYPPINERERRWNRLMHGGRTTRCLRASRHQPLDQNHSLFSHLSSHHHLHRSSTNMGLRKSFLKLFKKVRRKFTGGRHERDGGSGNDTDQVQGEAEVEGSNATQRNTRLHLEVEDAEIRPGREGTDVEGKKVGQVNPPTSTPSIPHSGGSDSM
jgi:hypothetical protein